MHKGAGNRPDKNLSSRGLTAGSSETDLLRILLDTATYAARSGRGMAVCHQEGLPDNQAVDVG